MRLQPTNANISGTSLVGHIFATPRQLERAFGEPEVDHPDSKIPVRWTLADGDSDPHKVFATIYLWNRSVPDGDTPVSWSIGGHSLEAVRLVHDAFRRVHNLTGVQA